jgi:hypothetical protein
MITAALHQPIAGLHCPEEPESASSPGARGPSGAQLPIRVALLAPGESDDEIAAAARRALATNPSIPRERVRVEVRDGRITLEGEVEWLYQCFDAYDAVSHVKQAAGCTNHINVVPRGIDRGSGKSPFAASRDTRAARGAEARKAGHGIDFFPAERERGDR